MRGPASPVCRQSMKRLRSIALWAPVIVASACRVSTAPERLADVAAPGERATIQMTTYQVAGGQQSTNVVVYDSAAATYEERTCPGSATVENCFGGSRISGRLDRVYFDLALRMAGSAEFRGLRPSYEVEGARPPDGLQVTLLVTAGQRRWQVTYDGRAKVPMILGRLTCTLRVAQGWLISCA